VQRKPEPIGPTLDRLRSVLGWLGRGRSEIGEHPKLSFQFVTEATRQTRRLKIEINTHEHFGSVLELPFTVTSRPLTAKVAIPTYSLDELLATKLRALYQRRKGRDLFDLWYANERGKIAPQEIIRLFGVYFAGSGLAVPSRASFGAISRPRGLLACSPRSARWSGLGSLGTLRSPSSGSATSY